MVEGAKVVDEALRQDTYKLHSIYTTLESFASRDIPDDIQVQIISPREMDLISNLKSSTSVLAILEIPNNQPIKLNGWSIYLDGVQDPGNVGTIIRTAARFNFDAVICGPETADQFNPKTIQAAKGSYFSIPIMQATIDSCLKDFEDNVILGADLDGDSITEIEIPSKGLLVLGSEGNGIKERTYAHINQQITIEGNEHVESLNVAIAAGIICHHIFTNKS